MTLGSGKSLENTWNRVKIPLFEVGKWLLVAMAVVFIYSLLAQGRESSADFADVEAAITAAADLSDMEQGDNQMIRRLYGLDPDSFAGICLYYPTTNMGAEELLLVELTDLSQQDAVVSAVEERIASQMSSFDGYGVTQYEMLENAVVEVQGNYLLLAVAADPTPIRTAFLGAL